MSEYMEEKYIGEVELTTQFLSELYKEFKENPSVENALAIADYYDLKVEVAIGIREGLSPIKALQDWDLI